MDKSQTFFLKFLKLNKLFFIDILLYIKFELKVDCSVYMNDRYYRKAYVKILTIKQHKNSIYI